MSNSIYYPPVISIGGDFDSGKDSVGSILVKTYGYTRVAFGDALKDICHQFLNGRICPSEFPQDVQNIIEEHRKDPCAVFRKPTTAKMRRLLQYVGTDYYRALDPDYWVNMLDDYVQPLLRAGRRVVATDMRFDNEGAWAENNNGEEWITSRPGLSESPHRKHLSENAYTRTPHFIINNDGSLGLLTTRVIDGLQDAQARHLAKLQANIAKAA